MKQIKKVWEGKLYDFCCPEDKKRLSPYEYEFLRRFIKNTINAEKRALKKEIAERVETYICNGELYWLPQGLTFVEGTDPDGSVYKGLAFNLEDLLK